MSLKGRGPGAPGGALLIHERGAEAREAGERRKPTASAMGEVRGRRNKPAKRATGISRRFLSPASRALLHQELPVGPAHLGAGRQFSAVNWLV